MSEYRVDLRSSRWLTWLLLGVGILLVGGTAVGIATMSGTADPVDRPEWSADIAEFDGDGLSQEELEKQLQKLQVRNKKLQKDIEKLLPRNTYIIIDTARNRLFLKQDKQLLRSAVCSTGSGRELEDPNKNRKWIFDTPRGEFQVRGKVKDPVWRKPDWAFIEDGLPVPRREEDRFESGVLGDYGLAFGDGFFIHGTLYSRLLGKSVTHGCVRLGDDDLEYVFEKTPLFSKIYIF